MQLHLRRAGVEGALAMVSPSVARAPVPKQRNTSLNEEERKQDEKSTTAAIDERIEVDKDVKKKGLISGNTLGRLRSDNLFPSSSVVEETKNDDRSLIISEDRPPLVKGDLKKKGLATGSSMKRLDSGSLFMSSSGSSSFNHRNGDPLGPLGNDLIPPHRVFRRSDGTLRISLFTLYIVTYHFLLKLTNYKDIRTQSIIYQAIRS